MRNSPDLHWAAGLFEGEGTITIAVRNQDETYRLVCMMGNTDLEVVDFFQKRWPGWVSPFYGERPGRRPGQTWTVAGPRAERFVRNIRPALRTSRVTDKANLALTFREVQATGRKGPTAKTAQRALYLEMKRLNRRGTE